MPCKVPGCVAEARESGLCPVHLRPDGAEHCPKCHGGGKVMRYEGSKPVEQACDVCAGCGFIDRRRSQPRPLKPAPVDDRDLMKVMRGE